MRAASCISVPITCKPPSSATPGSSLMSVPRPAMFVATVTLPRCPARATMSASLAISFAFKHAVLDPGGRQQARERLRFVDRPRADQHGPTRGVQLLNLLHDRSPFLLAGAEHADRQGAAA